MLLDTGPLIALIDKTDGYHERCVGAMATNTRRLLTCLPVLTEAAYILGTRHPKHVTTLMEWAADQAFVEIAPVSARHLPQIAELMVMYKIQFADACLLDLADRFECDTVFSLDERDFSKARTQSGRSLIRLP